MDTVVASTALQDDVAQASDNSSGSWSPKVHLKSRDEITPAELNRIEQVAYLHSPSPESYDVVSSVGSILKTPCERGLMNVFVNGKYWHVSGGIIAPEELTPDIVSWIRNISVHNKQSIALYSVSEEDLPLYVDAGFEVTKFGEEPILELGDIDWKGKPYEWVRRQTNYCKRAGLSVSEVTDLDNRPELASELNDVLFEDLKTRTYPKPLRLLVGEFDPESLHRKRLFVVRSPETNRVEAMLACSPMKNGTCWSFETYRKRNDSPRGVVPYLFRTVIDQLQNEGVQRISLCIVPGRGVHEWKSEKMNWLAKNSLSMWYRHLNFLFNTKGQDHFKSRFRPTYHNRYICVTPSTSIRSILNFLDTVGSLYPHPVNLIRNLIRRK